MGGEVDCAKGEVPLFLQRSSLADYRSATRRPLHGPNSVYDGTQDINGNTEPYRRSEV